MLRAIRNINNAIIKLAFVSNFWLFGITAGGNRDFYNESYYSIFVKSTPVDYAF
jgi:hypothetical protein